MKNLNNNNIPTLTVDKCVETLSTLYANAINNNIPLKSIPSLMLWGAPGVGKSQGIRQIASRLQEETGKRCNVTDVRLLLFNPIDLRGIPTANAEKTLAVWLKPQIFQMDESDDVVNILFLDEISAAPQSVQAAAYQITLDRIIGEHKLPDNCIVIAAGNRVTDKSVAYKMPRALANRLCHFEIESNFESWQRWAITSGISPKVVGFLSFRQDYLIENENTNDDLAFTTPRSWEMVSNILKLNNDDVDASYSLICGLVGTGVAVEFASWCRIFASLPKIEDIFKGKCKTVPSGTDVLYALVASMTAYAREHSDNIRELENSINYAFSLPSDYAFVLVKNYIALGLREKLLGSPSFVRFLNTKGKMLNG